MEEQATATGILGTLTEDEQTVLLSMRQEAQQLLVKLGEYDVLKSRALARLDVLEQQGQDRLRSITERLKLPEGTSWCALADGTVRLAPGPGQPAP